MYVYLINGTQAHFPAAITWRVEDDCLIVVGKRNTEIAHVQVATVTFWLYDTEKFEVTKAVE